MENYSEKLKKQLKEIEYLLDKSNKNLSKLQNIQECGTRVSKSNGCIQYYWIDKTTNKKVYAKGSDMDMLKKAAQRNYERKVNKKLVKLRNKLSAFLREYDIDEIEREYSKLPDARKKLIIPIIDSKMEFAEKWKNVSYERMPVNEETDFISANGIKVRSKSELIIANMLEQKGIPYRYEYPLLLKGVGTVRPDFMCLNIRTGKEYVWEHFGMMDNIAYATKNINKIQTYEQNGYLAGKNMIMTFETSTNALNTSSLRCVLEEYLL